MDTDITFNMWELSEEVAVLFSDTLLKDATRSHIEQENFHLCLEYGRTPSSVGFTKATANFLSRFYGETVLQERLLATYGATHGATMAVQHFLEAGDYLITEELSYGMFVQSVKEFGLKVLSVSTQEDGINLVELEEKLSFVEENSPRMLSHRKPFRSILYAMTVYSNPTGRVYSAEKCSAMVRLARKYNALIITDDVYNVFHYGCERTAPFPAPPRRLLAYDDASDAEYKKGSVVSNGSFSKIFSPALRVGWIESSAWIIGQLEQRGDVASGGGYNVYNQGLVQCVLEHPNVYLFIEDIKRIYAKRYYAAAEILANRLHESGVEFSVPDGSFFLWLRLPPGTSSRELLVKLQQRHALKFSLPESFTDKKEFDNCLRISVGYQSYVDVVSGMEKFCDTVQDFLALQ